MAFSGRDAYNGGYKTHAPRYAGESVVSAETMTNRLQIGFPTKGRCTRNVIRTQFVATGYEVNEDKDGVYPFTGILYSMVPNYTVTANEDMKSYMYQHFIVPTLTELQMQVYLKFYTLNVNPVDGSVDPLPDFLDPQKLLGASDSPAMSGSQVWNVDVSIGSSGVPPVVVAEAVEETIEDMDEDYYEHFVKKQDAETPCGLAPVVPANQVTLTVNMIPLYAQDGVTVVQYEMQFQCRYNNLLPGAAIRYAACIAYNQIM